MPPYIAPELKQRVGVWGPPSSTLDWCEENYIITSFIAEFWNTVSNLIFLLLAAVGLWYSIKYKCEHRYIACYIGLLIVGVGSFMFHGTLKWTMQLLDELPMLILSAYIIFALLEMGGARGLHTIWTYINIFVLVTYTTVVSLVYIIINDPTFHEVAYALMVLVITYFGFRNLGKYGKWKYLTISLLSFSLYLFAFALWNIDNHFCPSLRIFRSTSILFGVVTQFHAWWHFLAAVGTYLSIMTSSRIRMEYLGHPCSQKCSHTKWCHDLLLDIEDPLDAKYNLLTPLHVATLTVQRELYT